MTITGEDKSSVMTGVDFPLLNRSSFPRSEYFSSCSQQSEMYISRKSLAFRLILNNHLPTIVVDIRDNDSLGGMIQGALHCPEYFFRKTEIKLLIERAKLKRRECNTGISYRKCFVVFYSTDDLKQSTKCALRLRKMVQKLNQTSEITVKILRGNADAWISSYLHDHRLVEGFDKKHWAIKTEDETNVMVETCNDAFQPQT